MLKHADSDRLAQALKRCHHFSIPWSGTLFRSASVRYANRDDFLTGAGSKVTGARWNPPDSFAATYTSPKSRNGHCGVFGSLPAFQMAGPGCIATRVGWGAGGITTGA